MIHDDTCPWARTTPDECPYRTTHNYCPHPEHACDCDAGRVSANERLLAQIEERRNDPEFMAQLDRIMAEEADLLERLRLGGGADSGVER